MPRRSARTESELAKQLEARMRPFVEDTIRGGGITTRNLTDDLGWINVKNRFGGRGTGVGDETQAITDAIEAQGGRRHILYFPPGTYTFDSSIDLKRAKVLGTAAPGISGGGGTVLQFNGTAGLYSSQQDNYGFRLENIQIVGANGGTPTQSGQILIDFTGQNYPELNKVRIRRGDIGIKLDKGATVECNYGRYFGVEIDQCYWATYIKGPHSNSHSFYGGRWWSNVVGAKIGTSYVATDIDGDGVDTITVTTSTAHGLVADRNFSVYGSANFDGRYRVVTVPTPTTLTGVSLPIGHFTISSATNDSGTLIEIPTNINLHGVSFERSTEYAVDSYGENVAFYGCRFENSDFFGALASVYLREGAGSHFRFGCHWSSGFDVLDDNLPTRMQGVDAVSGIESSATVTAATARNLVANGLFDTDQDGNGVADGWLTTQTSGSLGSNYTAALVASSPDPEEGNWQQLVNVDANNPRLYQVITTVPGHQYTLRLRYILNTGSGQTQLRVGTGVSGDDTHLIRNLVADSIERELRYTFTATTVTTNITFYIIGTNAATLYVNGVMVTPGTMAPIAYTPKALSDRGGIVYGNTQFHGELAISDGVTAAPSATAGLAKIYIDPADGDLKCVFGNGFVATLAADS